MIKSSLIKKLLKNNPHLIQRDIEIIVDTVLENIGDSLSNKGRVEIRGLALFLLDIEMPETEEILGLEKRL